MKTVLQFINSFHTGGSERQAVQLARLLSESGRYRLRVACLDGSGVLREEVERLGLDEIPEYPLTSFYDHNMLAQLRRCAAYLREQKIDVVQTHDFYTNVFGILAARLARVPVRISSRRETGGMRSGAQKKVERGIYRLSHAVVANSEAVRRQLVAEGVNDSKIVTVYNGLDLGRVQPSLSRDEALQHFNLPREGARRFVTIVANLRHDVKDHPTFLRAARRVHEEVPEAAFVLAGEGELTEKMRALAAELGLERDVFFTGRCDRVADLLAISDVCVLSSRAEGFSNSILEYMAAGRPVVATRVGGASEAVVEGETGYLVAAGDDEQMAARIVALLRDENRARRMGQRGRAIVEQRFSCEAQLTRTVSLYDQLLMKERTSHAQKLEGVRREST
ncbi:MAG: L-malate glycosyltransferase [Acidobacteriota bacterium]|nr:L-malate glycosyltransferase [Acidobacteriota bacterium]